MRSSPERPWSVPVALKDVPEVGRRFELVADAPTRAAIARIAGLRSLPRLNAEFDVTRRGREGMHVHGTVSATVGQTCVVTLEPIENEINEPVDLGFVPDAAATKTDLEVDVANDDAPEPLINGTVDLGVLATEFLVLGLDPYPRKPDAGFEPPSAADDPASHPFASLASLKDSKGDGNA
jgi:uncharacterized metal-binding protein YceD (DUF177 family)